MGDDHIHFITWAPFLVCRTNFYFSVFFCCCWSCSCARFATMKVALGIWCVCEFKWDFRTKKKINKKNEEEDENVKVVLRLWSFAISANPEHHPNTPDISDVITQKASKDDKHKNRFRNRNEEVGARQRPHQDNSSIKISYWIFCG